jgi:hypothetical protein
MNPGLFDRIIDIDTYSDVVTNGSVTPTYTPYETIRARFITKNGGIQMVAAQAQYGNNVEFIFNTKDAPLTKSRDRVIMNNAVYRVESVATMPELGRNRYSKILAVLITNNI